MIRLGILPNSGVPAYRQLYEQLSQQILSGELPPGTTLPPIRTVSKELGVSVITVRNAWDELISDGLIESRTGSGCFVAEIDNKELRSKRSSALTEKIAELTDAAKNLGFSVDELIELIKEKY